MPDPAYIATKLTGPQGRRLVALARAGQSLPWKRTDDALQAAGLVRRYSGVFGEAFAEINDLGLAVVGRLRMK